MRVHYLDNGGGARVLTAKCYGRRLVSDGVVSGDGSTAARGLEAKPETSLYIIHTEVGIYMIYIYIYRIRKPRDQDTIYIICTSAESNANQYCFYRIILYTISIII